MKGHIPSHTRPRRNVAHGTKQTGTYAHNFERWAMTQNEVAASLGITRNAVSEMERRALKKLRAKFEVLEQDAKKPPAYRFIDGMRVDRVRGGWAAEYEGVDAAFAVEQCPWKAAAIAALRGLKEYRRAQRRGK